MNLGTDNSTHNIYTPEQKQWKEQEDGEHTRRRNLPGQEKRVGRRTENKARLNPGSGESAAADGLKLQRDLSLSCCVLAVESLRIIKEKTDKNKRVVFTFSENRRIKVPQAWIEVPSDSQWLPKEVLSPWSKLTNPRGQRPAVLGLGSLSPLSVGIFLHIYTRTLYPPKGFAGLGGIIRGCGQASCWKGNKYQRWRPGCWTDSLMTTSIQSHLLKTIRHGKVQESLGSGFPERSLCRQTW